MMDIIMKNGALILFIILILGLILCSFLGNKEGFTSGDEVVKLNSGVSTAPTAPSSYTNKTYDNYDHYSKTSTPTVYHGPDGTAKIMKHNDVYSIVVTNSSGDTTTYIVDTRKTTEEADTEEADTEEADTEEVESSTSSSNAITNSIFYGPNGGSARIFTGKDNQYVVEVTQSNGNIIIYTPTNSYTYDQSNAGISNQYKNQYYDQPYSNSSSSTYNSSVYDSSLPEGIPKRMIPPGQENLYILKSEIVPPVCPACPSSSACPRTEKCPPCPACARCPEPNFECKKVPNYGASSSSSGYDSDSEFNSGFSNSNSNNSYLPVPVVSSFSTFGM